MQEGRSPMSCHNLHIQCTAARGPRLSSHVRKVLLSLLAGPTLVCRSSSSPPSLLAVQNFASIREQQVGGFTQVWGFTHI